MQMPRLHSRSTEAEGRSPVIHILTKTPGDPVDGHRLKALRTNASESKLPRLDNF